VMNFASNYFPPFQAFDEMKAPLGFVRPHWEPLMRSLEGMGAEGLRECRNNVQELLREHGVTYNVNSDGESAQRTWDLDVLPLVINAAEWAELEAGLIQRTRLLNLVLADIYGPQNLLRDGLLPPALLHANPGFLRCCHGIKPPSGLFLTLHAVDLTREPNGRWWVLSDSTQAPSGIGYALENRAISSRILSNEFRNFQIQRLGGFFTQRKAGLLTLARWTNSANIVVLTSGPFTETYFEHAYLARYLGYPLVEGSDLTVRDRCVYLKTIEGLQRIDVIIRRVDDTWSDPLELRADSMLGVPGLVDAARAGNVTISNALGAGAVETTAILAFLPALSRHLLGEKLRISNVATWWCGQEAERNHVLRSIRSLVIKRAFVGGKTGPNFTDKLDPANLEALASAIREDPYSFVGQERVALSTAPVWNGRALEPRPLILRCYICATPEGFSVMPGGLTRVSPYPDSPIVSSRFGGGSKDTWVCSSAPIGMAPSVDAVQPIRSGHRVARVPSRLVENLFWLGRYAERLEDTTRLLRTVYGRLTGEGGPLEDLELNALTHWFAHAKLLPGHFGGRFDSQQLISELDDHVFDKDKAGSVHELLTRVTFLTTCVRDRLSGDTWRILNQLQTEFPSEEEGDDPSSIIPILHRVIFHLAAFNGMEMENMTRGHAWLFLDIGRRLERAINIIANVRSVIATGPERAALLPLLEYTDSVMTYRRRQLAQPELTETCVLLLADESNPRSLAFQFKTLRAHLAELPHEGKSIPAAQAFAELSVTLEKIDFVRLTKSGAAGCSLLGGQLDYLHEGCRKISDLLSENYFSHSAARIS